MSQSTWEHQHHDLVSAKEECGKYPGVSVESLSFSFDESCHMFLMWFVPRFVITLADTPFDMVCLTRDLFSDLRSHLLVYSYRFRLLLLRRFARAPFIQWPSTSCHVKYHMPLSPHLVSHLLSPSLNHFSPLILHAIFPLKTLHSNHRRGKKRKKKINNFFSNKQLTELSPPPGVGGGVCIFSNCRQLLQHQQLLQNQISQNLLCTGM